MPLFERLPIVNMSIDRGHSPYIDRKDSILDLFALTCSFSHTHLCLLSCFSGGFAGENVGAGYRQANHSIWGSGPPLLCPVSRSRWRAWSRALRPELWKPWAGNWGMERWVVRNQIDFKGYLFCTLESNFNYLFSALTYDEVISFVPPSFDEDDMESWGGSGSLPPFVFQETLSKDYRSHVTIRHFPHTRAQRWHSSACRHSYVGGTLRYQGNEKKKLDIVFIPSPALLFCFS